MKRVTILYFFLASAVFGQGPHDLLVAAAANLGALESPLKHEFEKAYPEFSLRFTFGASGGLVTQISHGAPFDAFLSADREFAQRLVDQGWALGPVKTYAVGRLILLSTSALDCSRGLAVLLDSSVVQFANSNPETAPYGRAAVHALASAGLYEQVKGKQVTAQSVAQALQFTLTATGLGFVSRSALLAPEVKRFDHEGTTWFEVDPRLYPPLDQGFVLMKTSAGRPEARAFATFLGSPEALAIFEAYGYGHP